MEIPIIYAYFFFFIQIAIWLSITVSRCKIFQKSNERWWKALIPYYNKYIELKIAKKKKFFSSLYLILYIMVISAYSLIIIELLISGYDLLPHASLSNIIGSFLAKIIETLAVVLFWIGPHVVFTINIFKYIGLVCSFNLKGWFVVGLSILPFIFYPILAFGKSQYIGDRYSSNTEKTNIENGLI